MPALKCLIFAAALLCALSGPASAACDDLGLAIDLTERNFAPGEASDPAELAQLNGVITTISNDDLLFVLRSGGQANAFGNLRNFLTQIKFITASPDRPDFRLTPQMQADLDFARELVDAVCADGGPQSDLPSSASKAPAMEGEKPLSTLTRWPDPAKIFGKNVGTALEDDGELYMLAELVLLVLVAASLVIAGRYALQLIRLMQRKRRICAIPAELVCMMTSLPGHLTMLELTSCTFTPSAGQEAEDMRDVSAGTYCTIWIDGVDVSARLTTQIRDQVEVLFDQPITASTLASFLAQSKTPVRFDFSALRDRRRSVMAT